MVVVVVVVVVDALHVLKLQVMTPFCYFPTAGWGGVFFFSGPQPDPNTFVDASY